MTTTLDVTIDAFEILMKDDSTSKLFSLWEQLEGPKMREHALSVMEMLTNEECDPSIICYGLGRIKSA